MGENTTSQTKTNASSSELQSTATSAAWLLHFRDARPPQEILPVMEENIVKVFSTSTKDGRLAYSAQAKINGAQYTFDLHFEAALPGVNCYSLRIEASWSAMPANSHEYFRKTAGGWIDFWTRSFQRGEPVKAGEGSVELYTRLCDEALQAEARLGSVPAIQQAIVAGMKRGSTFFTAHKEGGTILKWSDGCFIRSDYGESSELKKFADEAEFLKFLRQFYDWDTSRAVYPDKVPDLDAWKLILGKLRSR
jgi:hypothetical protein